MRFLVFLGLFLGSTFAQAGTLVETAVPERLAQLVIRCEAIESMDVLACPRISAYRWESTTTAVPNARTLNQAFRSEGYNVEASVADEAAGVLDGRLSQQIEALEEYFNVGEITNVPVREARAIASDLKDYVRGWQQVVFLDDNYYWGPSVNASVVVLVNPLTGVVISIVHGDTDG